MFMFLNDNKISYKTQEENEMKKSKVIQQKKTFR